ncbi:MAG: UDP-glucose/GDP-mannose dehydrogenase family protein [Patescibacteria group bacterium]|jgi:UDPglucose 6-dehydrogenase
MNISVIGTGYVGLVTGACLAEAGHQVTCLDINQEKISGLQRGIIPIFEPGLEAVVQSNVQLERLKFTTDLADAIPQSEVVIIAVGTPSAPDGTADLQYVFAAAEGIAKKMQRYTVIVTKSTVPVGTGKKVEAIIKQHYTGDFAYASCPEFLREGCAVDDFFSPDRVVIGVRNDQASAVMLDMFKPIRGQKVVTTVESAELIKYASNAFLATKISFINEIAQVCERMGADIEEVAYGVGLDHRIGPKFLKAGIGWGGSCFPKDVSALGQMAGASGYDFRLLQSVIEVNHNQRKHFIARVREHIGEIDHKKIGVLGLAFKDNTDDIRESAAIDVIQQLVAAGVTVTAFDYQATEAARRVLPDTVKFASDPYEVAAQADAVLVLTEWKEFKELDWVKIKDSMIQPVVFDGRNLLKPKTMIELGFHYYSIGR